MSRSVPANPQLKEQLETQFRTLLPSIAFCISVFLATTLAVLGINKYFYVLAGGRKFATFPDDSFRLAIGASYLILSIAYLFWLRQIRTVYSHASPLPFRSLLRSAFPFLGLAFLSYPLGNDIYVYLHAGLMNLSGVNPYFTRADAFVSGLTPFIDWGQTSTYGPVAQVIFRLCASLIAVHPLVAVYSFKAICLALHVLNAYGIYRLLAPRFRTWVTIAYLLHPLLLMEQVGSAHVDVLVSTSIVLFAAALFQKQYTLASIALWIGFLSKTLPLVWMPMLGVFLLRQARSKGIAFVTRQILPVAIVSIATVAICSLTLMPELAAWKSILNPGVAGLYQSSLPVLVRFGLDLLRIFDLAPLTQTSQTQFLNAFSRLSLLAFAILYLGVLWRIWRRRSYQAAHLMHDIGWITIILLLFATSWLMPWYASVLLTIAALMPQMQLFGIVSLAFNLSSSAQYLLQGHDSLKALVSIGLPLGVWGLGLWLLYQMAQKQKLLDFDRDLEPTQNRPALPDRLAQPPAADRPGAEARETIGGGLRE